MTGFCDSFSFCDSELRIGGVNIFWFSFGILQSLITLGIIAYTRSKVSAIRKINEKIAAEASLLASEANDGASSDQISQTHSEDDFPTSPLILPVYVWYLWLIASVTLVQGVANMVFPLRVDEENSWSASTIFATIWALQRFCIEGIAFFLMQHGAGLDAMKTAMLHTTFVSFVTFCVMLFIFRFPSSSLAFGVQMFWEAGLLLFYLCLVFLSPTMIFSRPALKNYSIFWVLFRVIQMASTLLLHIECEFGHCLYELSVTVLFGLGRPFIAYYTFKQDSLYWQGLFLEDQSNFSSSPLTTSTLYSNTKNTTTTPKHDRTHGTTSVTSVSHLSTKSNRSTPKIYASSAINIVREINTRAGKVKFLNFSHISIIDQTPVGSGGSARVYKGLFDGRIVAVKTVYCLNLTPSTIRNFFKEATLLSGLRHPNVVFIEGVCVIPPSIGLVMEFCHHGSLYDFLARDSARADTGQKKPPKPRSPHGVSVRSTSTGTGAGTGTMSSPLLHHQDKLRPHVRLSMALDCARAVAFLHSQNPPVLHKDIKSLNFLVDHSYVVKISDLELSTNASLYSSNPDDHLLPSTVHWTAPEILSRKSQYTQKCDVYSVAVVIWEVMTSRVPFSEHPEFRNKKALAALIVEQRLRPQVPTPMAKEVAEIIETAWSDNPDERMTADELFRALEALVPNQLV